MDKRQKLAKETRGTPSGVMLARVFEAVAPGFLALYAFAAGLQASAQLLATANRRIIASLVAVFLFILFCLYLHWRKPSWIGPGGITQKITHPKLRHCFFLVGILFFTWAPAIPWLMPRSQLELATTLEIQREVSVLEEKTRVADLLYRRMKDDEHRVERFLSFPPKLRLLLPPPTPYLGLADQLQADLPRFGVTLPQRAAELDVAGEEFKTRARIYRQLEQVEDREREVIVGFRIWWQDFANNGEWTTPIGAYQRTFQYLILGVYLRTLRDLQADLRSIGLSPPPIPYELASMKDPINNSDQKRFDQGLPPKLEYSDFTAEVHCCLPPPLR